MKMKVEKVKVEAEVPDAVPDVPEELRNRKAKCMACGREEDSALWLPEFIYNEKSSFDAYYCGCEGWV